MSESSSPRRAFLLSGSFLGGRLTLSVEPAFLLAAALLGGFGAGGDLALAAGAAAIVAVSVLVHELGHAFACLAFGSPADVVLRGFGGFTRPRGARGFRTWQTAAMTAAGPAAGLFLAFLCSRPQAMAWAARFAGLPRALPLARYALSVNFLWSLFNLLPVSPLDGGQLTATLLRGRFGLRGLRAAHALGAVVGGLGAAVSLLAGGLYAAALLGALALGEVSRWRRARTLTEADFDELLHAEIPAAQAAWREGRAQEALARLARLRRRARGGRLHRAATEQLARWLLERGRRRAAYVLLRGLDEAELMSGSRLALQELAYGQGDYETSIRLGQTNFHENPDPQIAAAIAAACAGLGDARLGLQWLSTALRRGLPDAEEALRDAAFDPIRRDPGFAELEGRARER